MTTNKNLETLWNSIDYSPMDSVLTESWSDQDGRKHVIVLKNDISFRSERKLREMLSSIYKSFFMTGNTCWNRSYALKSKIEELGLEDGYDYITVTSMLYARMFEPDSLTVMSMTLAWLNDEI